MRRALCQRLARRSPDAAINFKDWRVAAATPADIALGHRAELFGKPLRAGNELWPRGTGEPPVKGRVSKVIDGLAALIRRAQHDDPAEILGRMAAQEIAHQNPAHGMGDEMNGPGPHPGAASRRQHTRSRVRTVQKQGGQVFPFRPSSTGLACQNVHFVTERFLMARFISLRTPSECLPADSGPSRTRLRNTRPESRRRPAHGRKGVGCGDRRHGRIASATGSP
jgi:hypothetical protein